MYRSCCFFSVPLIVRAPLTSAVNSVLIAYRFKTRASRLKHGPQRDRQSAFENVAWQATSRPPESDNLKGNKGTDNLRFKMSL
jgi:hypothetical protein